MNRYVMWARTGLLLVASAVLLLVAFSLKVQTAAAQTLDPCAKQNARLERTGRGDRDFDGLSNCTEKKVLGTSLRDPDTDDDGVGDGTEIEDGTDPLDPDSDDDGLEDGDEKTDGTDPLDTDSDDDGVDDGDDPDPGNDLRNQLEGDIQAITCPTDLADGSLTLMCLDIILTADTEYDGAENCDDLAARFATNGGAHVEVEVAGDTCGAAVAKEVDLEDADNDGAPDLTDDDDDNDGIPDDVDDDDDNDGIPDDVDDDDATD